MLTKVQKPLLQMLHVSYINTLGKRLLSLLYIVIRKYNIESLQVFVLFSALEQLYGVANYGKAVRFKRVYYIVNVSGDDWGLVALTSSLPAML